MLFSIFLQPCTPIKPMPRLCKNCKHFLNPLGTIEFGKCALLLQPIDNLDYFITGKKKIKSEYYFCSVARKFDDLCGKKGKLFEPQ